MNVKSIRAYRVPPPPFPTDLRLDGTRGGEFAASLAETLASLDVTAWSRYPDAAPLESAIAERLGVDPARVVVTAGADEALDRACRALLAPGRRLVLPVPTFEMIPRYALLAGAEIVEVPWRDRWPLDAVVEGAREGADLVAVVSPNNPTGAVATRDELQRLADALPSTPILVDLAYVEFADDDPTAEALAIPRAIVFRTFSKAWGLPGLRVGYAVAPPEIAGWMRAAGGPYPVASVALALAGAWLERGGEAMRAFVARVRDERAALERLLAERGAVVQPSQANFVFARFRDAGRVRDELARRGIAVRIFPGLPGLEDALRLTLPGEAAAFARVVRAFEEILPEEESR
jgi:histidinol-phosphate aminotransferase